MIIHAHFAPLAGLVFFRPSNKQVFSWFLPSHGLSSKMTGKFWL